MHGFILLLASSVHWRKDQSIFDEIRTRLDKIEAIFKEVSRQAPDWNKIKSLLEGFPNHNKILESLKQDGEMLKELPSRWERERRETMALLSFMKTVINFQALQHPELKSEINRYLKENTEKFV